MVCFDGEDDLELIMAGRPRLFRRQVVLFDRLLEPIERRKVRLVRSPFWVNIDPCPPDSDKKDLAHAVGSTFGGLQCSKILDDFCRLKVMVDVTRPLRRGVFVSMEDQGKVWLAFKYENLPIFCFNCGIMGLGVRDCDKQHKRNPLEEEDMPYSNALKAETTLMGKEWMKFGPFKNVPFVQKANLGEEFVSDGVSDRKETTVGGAASLPVVPGIGISNGGGLTSNGLKSPKNQEDWEDLKNDLGDLPISDLGNNIDCNMMERLDLDSVEIPLNKNDLNINLPALPPLVKQSTWVRIQRADVAS